MVESAIRIDPLSAIVRYFKKPIEQKPLHEMKEPYYKTLTLQFLDDGTVRITAIKDIPSREEISFLREELKKIGILQVEWRHKHKKTVVKV